MTERKKENLFSVFSNDRYPSNDDIITVHKLADILDISSRNAQFLMEDPRFPATHVIDNTYIVQQTLLHLWITRTTPIADWMQYTEKCSIYPALEDTFRGELLGRIHSRQSDSNSDF
jgi:hypothetical protein